MKTTTRVTEKVGNVAVPIYPTRSKGYDGFTVAWYEDGKRHRKFFAALKAGRRHAREVATRIENQERQILRLSSEDARVYSNAIAQLKPIGISLDGAMREFISAREVVGAHPILDALSFWKKHHGDTIVEKRVPVVVAELVRALDSDGNSRAHVDEMKRALGKFAAAFRGNIGEVTTAEIDAYLRGIGVTPATRNIYRRKIVTLFNHARRVGYLPDRTTAATKAAKAKEIEKETEIYTPEQMGALLNHASESLRPFLVLCGFCGLRAAEAMRVDWSEIDFDRATVLVKAGKSKTQSRRFAPLPRNAAAWLAPVAQRTGPVVTVVMIVNALRRLGKRANVQMKRNGLRHSFCSYRLESTQNANQTALEAGHGVGVLFKRYRQLCTKEQADDWFSISPIDAANIVGIPAKQRAA